MNSSLINVYSMGITIILLGMTTIGCTEVSSEQDSYVLIGANPPSLIVGETITAELKSDRDFFDNELQEFMVSDGGLMLQSLSVQGPRQAIAVFASSENTEFGNHSFVLTAKGCEALIVISVLNASPGPGRIASVQGNTLTAGAHLAQITIWGDKTNFDPDMSFDIIGAKGAKIVSWTANTKNNVEILIDVEIEQAPTLAWISITDGDYNYKIPINILAPIEYESLTHELAVKGQVSWVKVKHPDAVLHSSTILKTGGTPMEGGPSRLVKENEIIFPIRFPLDEPKKAVKLQAWTYLDNGATLQIVNFEVDLLEPIGVIPGEIVLEEELLGVLPLYFRGLKIDEVVEIKAVDFSDFKVLSFDKLGDNDIAAINIEFFGQNNKGPFVLDVITENRTLPVGFWKDSEDGWANWSPGLEAYPGDSVLFPMVTSGFDEVDNWYVEPIENLTVSFEKQSEKAALLLLEISKEIQPGFKQIAINADGKRVMAAFNVLGLEFWSHAL